MKKRAALVSIAVAIIAMIMFCGFILFRITHKNNPPDSTAEISMYEENTKETNTTEETKNTDNSTTPAKTTSESLTAKIATTKELFSSNSSSKNQTSVTATKTNTANNVSEEKHSGNQNTEKISKDSASNTNKQSNSSKATTGLTTAIQNTKTHILETSKTKSNTTKTSKFTVGTTKKTTTTTTTTTAKETTTEPPIVTDPPLTPVDPNYELFGAYYERATQTLSTMTLDEKVGQLFLASYPGYQIALNQTNSNCPAGYVLFAIDFQNHNPSSIRNNMDTIKANSKYGLLLGADEEGGGVVRISMYQQFRSYRFQSPQNLFKQGGLQAIFDEAAEKAELMKNIGLNYNLAPVVDMPRNSYSYIYGRTLGQDAQTTADFSAGVVRVWNEHQMMATLKHFPGYGDNVDTHTGVAVDYRDRATFDNEDLQPFISGIQAGVPMIMVNHNIITCMDGTKPASLSEEVHRVLREDLGYTGLIVTDALTMGAVKQYASNGEAAVQAILCGNDLIATTDFVNQKREVLNAVNDGRIPEEMVNNAVRRVLACKYYYGILQ